jgi:hypothetical protein
VGFVTTSLVLVAGGRRSVVRFGFLGECIHGPPLLRYGRESMVDGTAFGQKHGCHLIRGRQLGSDS